MSARRAYSFIYSQVVKPLDEDARLEVDALLGDPAAAAERDRRRRAAVQAAGIEVG